MTADYVVVPMGWASAIVFPATAAAAAAQNAVEISLEETSTWGEFRMAGHDFDTASEVVSHSGYELEDFIVAIEQAHGLEPDGLTVPQRWERSSGYTFDGGASGELPADEDSFGYTTWEYGSELAWQFSLRCSTEQELPSEILEEFDVYERTSLDGDLVYVSDDLLDAVCARLTELGFTVERDLQFKAKA